MDAKATDGLILHNVVLPLNLDDRFIPPDLEAALEYYPSYARHTGSPWSVQAYLCWILKQIDLRHPNGYDGDRAFSEFWSHVGKERVLELLRSATRAEGVVEVTPNAHPSNPKVFPPTE